MSTLSFESPEALLILLVLIPLCAYVLFRRAAARRGTLRFPGVASLAGLKPGSAARLLPLVELLKVLGLVLLTVALARPRTVLGEIERHGLGTDLIVVLDASTSMKAADMGIAADGDGTEPLIYQGPLSRLSAAKKVIGEFIEGRPNDRLGLVVFAGFPFTACPLTRDRSVLLHYLDYVREGMIEDGTAIGDGVIAALIQLKRSTAKSKAIVLVTDGRDNRSAVKPLIAANIAAELGIRLHTILIGTQEQVAYRMVGAVIQRVEVPADPELLARMAEMTGGLAARVGDADMLAGIFERIDAMERTELPEKIVSRDEVFHLFLLPGVGLLGLGLVLSQTRFRRFV